MALTKLTVKKKNRDTVASVKEVFNTNRISGLIASGSDSVFYYTENVNGDRYAPDEYTVDETVATISGKWTGEDAIPISLPVLKKKVDGNEITLSSKDFAESFLSFPLPSVIPISLLSVICFNLSISALAVL